MAVREQFLKEIAQNSKYTLSELTETSKKLERAIQSRLHHHYKLSHLNRGADYWLSEDNEGVWLALNKYELNEEMGSMYSDWDKTALWNVGTANIQDFQSRGATVAIPGTIARSYEDPFFFPIHVSYPDGWEDGIQFTFQRFKDYIWRHKLSPAEALDYWVVTEMGQDATEWAGMRDIVPEGVRKNVRQAKEKLEDSDFGATHENGEIRTVSIDELPDDGVHDPDSDTFFIPTDDHYSEVEAE